jgi:hypothetical protein
MPSMPCANPGTTWLSGKLMGVSPRDQELSNGVPS